MNLILIRGLMREKRFWGAFPKEVEKSLPQIKVIQLELPGLGEKYKHQFPIDIKEVVKLMRNDFLKLQLQGPNCFMGLSLGGMVALKWAELYPNDMSHIVVMNTSASNVALPIERITPKGLVSLYNIIKAKNIREKEIATLKMVSNLRYNEIQTIDEWTKISESKPPLLKTALQQLLAATRFKAPKSISPRCLVLTSKKDQMVSFRCSKRLAKRLKAELKVNDVAGHDLTLDDSAWTIKKLKDFLLL